MDNSTEKVCKCSHHKIIPLLIIVLGLDFLFGQLNVLTPQAVSISWPTIIILIGFMKLSGGMCKCCAEKHS